MEKNTTSAKASVGAKTGRPAFAAGRYFKYAFGEIILVVIGILIALSINNWNEENKLTKQSRSHLKEIVKDLGVDTVQFNFILKRLNKTIDTEVLILSQVNHPNDAEQGLIPGILISANVRGINGRTFDKIQNSDNANLIGYQQIYDDIVSYYVDENRELQLLAQYDSKSLERIKDVFWHFISEGDYEIPGISKGSLESNNLPNFKRLNGATDNRVFLVDFANSLDGRNYVRYNLGRHLTIRDRYKTAKQKAIQLIQTINSSLDSDD
jgi:hypothetical protein